MLEKLFSNGLSKIWDHSNTVFVWVFDRYGTKSGRGGLREPRPLLALGYYILKKWWGVVYLRNVRVASCLVA